MIGKMNFYLEILDDTLKKKNENSQVGVILCKDKNKLVVEYALRDSKKPIAIATYEIITKLKHKFEDF